MYNICFYTLFFVQQTSLLISQSAILSFRQGLPWMRKQSCCRRTHDFGPFARGRLVGWVPLFPGFQLSTHGKWGNVSLKSFWNIPGVFFGVPNFDFGRNCWTQPTKPAGFLNGSSDLRITHDNHSSIFKTNLPPQSRWRVHCCVLIFVISIYTPRNFNMEPENKGFFKWTFLFRLFFNRSLNCHTPWSVFPSTTFGVPTGKTFQPFKSPRTYGRVWCIWRRVAHPWILEEFDLDEQTHAQILQLQQAAGRKRKW